MRVLIHAISTIFLLWSRDLTASLRSCRSLGEVFPDASAIGRGILSTGSFLPLVVMPLLLVAMPLFLVFLVVVPGAYSSFLPLVIDVLLLGLLVRLFGQGSRRSSSLSSFCQ